MSHHNLYSRSSLVFILMIVLTITKCQHDQSLTQNVSPITPSKVSRQKRASTSRPIASRAVSAKPAPAPAAPPPLQFDDALLFTGNSFDVSTPFSTEMSSADPSMLSFESTLGTNSAWDMPFDLGKCHCRPVTLSDLILTY